MTLPAKRRQSASERKPVILASFYEVIQEVGFENASVAKVAKKAGVHPSLVIHYFGTKEQMVLALVDETLDRYRQLIARLPTGGAPGVRLEKLLNLIWSRRWHRTVSFSVIFSIMALSARDKEVMKRLHNLYRAYRGYLAKQITLFAEAGIIQVTDEQAAVQALISLSEGSHYFSMYHVGDEALDQHCLNMVAAAKRVLGVQN